MLSAFWNPVAQSRQNAHVQTRHPTRTHTCTYRYWKEWVVIWRGEPLLCHCCHGDTVCSCHSCGTVTTHPKPHLHPKQTSIFPLLLFPLLSLPSPCVYLFLHPYRSLHLPHPPPPPPVWSLAVNARSCSVRLTNMEREGRRNSTDNRTLSLPCFSPRRLWQAWHTGGSNLITSVPHHTLCLLACGTPHSVSLWMFIW